MRERETDKDRDNDRQRKCCPKQVLHFLLMLYIY